MRYLHTMVRISNIDESLAFYRDALGLEEMRRIDNPAGRFTLLFLAAPGDKETSTRTHSLMLELTFNWDPEEYDWGRNFAVCERLSKKGVVINRPPRDGRMAFVRSPDGISVELLQKGAALPKAEPWASMANVGAW